MKKMKKVYHNPERELKVCQNKSIMVNNKDHGPVKRGGGERFKIRHRGNSNPKGRWKRRVTFAWWKL